ncbi:MAG: CpsD/CapB family tyrosine-protein kinase [Actinomycetota bacterium]|nr:CpsD/CapB family tyrosine-protein kinase [Actinomycetota bacterium]
MSDNRESSDGGGHRGGHRRRGGGSEHEDGAWFEEAYRVVRSNLMVSLADFKRPRVIVTSANPGEGKTVTCANLAVSFARAGQRVVFVDLDLRHPDAHRLVGAHNRFGVCDLLIGRRTLEECLQYLQLPGDDAQSAQGVYFIGTGPPVRNPTELLGLSRTALMLDELGKQADLILIDAPPVLPVADMLVIGRIVTGVVLVVEARRTTVTDISKTKDLLTRNQTRILGVVLNKLRQRDASHGDAYGYGTPFPAEESSPTKESPPSRNGKAASRDQTSRSGR